MIVLKSGSFILGSLIKNNKVTKSTFSIKLTEVKLIEPLDDESCIFSTYKDVHYMAYISADDLREIINGFIFNLEEYSKQWIDFENEEN